MFSERPGASTTTSSSSSGGSAATLSQIRLLLWGDVEGEFGAFEESLHRAVSKFGKFDLCICVGNFFGHISSIESVRQKIPVADRIRSLLPSDLPIGKVFIVDQPMAEDSLGGELQAMRHSAPIKISDVFTVLPACGFCEIADHLRVATCSHHPSSADGFVLPSPPPDWNVFDLCLVTAWPENLQAGLQGDDLLALQNFISQSEQEDPIRARHTLNFLSALPLVRYIVATGKPKLFYQRPPFQRPLESPVPTRFISLSPMLLSSKPSTLPRKFLHALRVAPWALQPIPQPPVSRIANSPIPTAKRLRTRFDQRPEAPATPPALPPAPPPPLQQSFSPAPATYPAHSFSESPLSNDPYSPSIKRRESSISESLSDSAIVPISERKAQFAKVTLYVSNVPYGSNGDDIRRVVDPVARSVRVRFPRMSAADQKIGRAWVSFATVEDARRVLASPPIELNGRKLRFDWAKNSFSEARLSEDSSIVATAPTAGTSSAPMPSGASSGASVKIDTRPHQECWFCLINPNCERGLMCHVGKNAYVAVARGGINNHHCLILPASHEPNIGYSNSAALIEECNGMMEMLMRVNAAEGLGTIFFERYLPMKFTRTMHTQIHSVGVARSELLKLKHQFMYKIMEEGLGASGARPQPTNTCQQFDWRLYEEHTDLFTIVTWLSNQQITLAPKFVNDTYWWISIQDPGDAVFVPTTFVGVSQSTSGVNLNLAREIVTQTLNLPDRAQWKNCVTPVGQEAEAASQLKQAISTYLRNAAPSVPVVPTADDLGDTESTAHLTLNDTSAYL